MSTQQHVRVGVAVFALNHENKFILGQRIGSHGANTWALPGGHLELNESWETCAFRELEEETGLQIENIRYLTATNDIMEKDGKHYVTLFLTARVKEGQGEPQILEPNKCKEWKWVGFEELKRDWEAQVQADQAGEGVETKGRKLFIPLLSLFEQREGFSLE
ncbi:NUDIX hydrolase domain-like protein [Aspergillus karnatakaensis]|uniref:nucleotide triphosphate diphosphatase NUDT15 n=1 Tax=Aspergillus karnatakaensis TaxID=1810916 RepID=UPI003CCCC0F8